MEDENGLELSLGLSFGGSSVKSKSKGVVPLDAGAEEVGRGGKINDDFKNFLNAGNQRTDSSKPEENFFNDLSKAKEDNASVNLNGRGLWFADYNKPCEIKEDKRLETGNKRKMFFDETSNPKKHEIEVHHADSLERARTPHISIADDGSNAENENIADSEVENSTSKPFSLNNDGSRQFMRVGGSSDAPKVFKFSDSSATDLNGQKRFIGLSEKDFKLANLTYGDSIPVHQANLMNMLYPSPVKESNSVGAPSPQMAHAMPIATSECSGVQPTHNGNLPVMFQLPISDTDNSRGWGFHAQQLHPSFAGKGTPNSAVKHVISNNLSEVKPFEGRPSEQSKGGGNQLVTLQKCSMQAEDVKGSSTNLREKDVSDQSKEGFSSDVSAIKPGLAADVKFGGFGSCPNLPWVSATGSNGRTISGVTYLYSNNQMRIVCACHGSHMSPENFIRHANEDTANSDGGGTVASGNPSASAHG